MKFNNKFIFVIIGAVILYAAFLFISDLNLLSEKFSNFKIEFLPIILLIIPCSWMFLFLRWHLLLKNSNISISLRENLKIYFAGFALAITPGKFGELIKSQLMKNKFDIPPKKTSSLVLVERLYDLMGAIIVSFIGIFMIGVGGYVIILVTVFLLILFIAISSRKAFQLFLKIVSKIRFFEKYSESLLQSYEMIRISTRGKIIFTASLTTVIYWLLESIGVFFVLVALGIDYIQYLKVVAIYASSLIVGAASFIPGGIGVTEGSLIGLLNHQGVEISESFIAVIFIRMFTIWFSVIVGFISLKMSGGLSKK